MLNKDNIKFVRKVFIDEELEDKIFEDLYGIFNSLNKFDEKHINMEIGHYIAKKYEEDKSYNNVLIYSILKLFITGNVIFPRIAAICEIIGKKETLKRLRRFKLVKKQLAGKYIEDAKSIKRSTKLLESSAE